MILRGISILMGITLTVMTIVFMIQTAFPILAKIPQEDWFGLGGTTESRETMEPRESGAPQYDDVADSSEEQVSSESEKGGSDDSVSTQTQKVAMQGTAVPQVSVDAVGVMRNGSFVPKDTIEPGDSAAIRVLAQNTGTAATGDWLIGFALPDGSYTQTELESRLLPGERAYVVVHFTAEEGEYTIPVAFVSTHGSHAQATTLAHVNVD